MPDRNVLFFAATTGYQTRAFEDAAQRLGVHLTYATDYCHRLDDPWRDAAISVKFTEPDASTRRVFKELTGRAVSGVLAIGDRPAILAAHVAAALGLEWHTPAGAAAARSKLQARGRFLAAGLPTPWFVALDAGQPLHHVADRIRFPCVVKPAALSASRGVMRANTPGELEAALARLECLLQAPDIRSLRDPETAHILIEGFVPGREYALEGVMDHGVLHVLAIFDKPDPLEGPFFEETIYVTPAVLPEASERLIAGTIAHGALALGLRHGPIHAECRVNGDGVFVLEIAARPIGGLCARSLRFVRTKSSDEGGVSLEALLLEHATGTPLDGYAREPAASGVMMIPVPGRGHFQRVEGLEDAARVEGIDGIVITAKPGQLLEPWPEGHSYPGFIFARRALPEQVVVSLRAAHRALTFRFATALPLAATLPEQGSKPGTHLRR